MRELRTKLSLTLLAVVLAFSANTASAGLMTNIWDLDTQGSVDLGTVIGQDLTLQVGDKLFYHDTWFSNAQALGGVILPTPAAITVSSSVSFEGYFGLQFNIVGFQANVGQAANFNLEFDVWVHPDFPDRYISDVHMDLIGGGAAGTGNASITEAVSDDQGKNVLVDDLGFEKTTLFVVANDQGFDRRQDWGYVEPLQKHISIFKDIGITGGTDGSAHISVFTQHFSQIPEPASLALLAMGGLVIVRRRKA